MKILVLSDTHGKIDCFNKIYDVIARKDLIIHLGDNTKDIEELKKYFKGDIHNVKGNCDYMDNTTLEEKIINIEGKKIFLTHGHRYGVKRDLNTIYYKVQELGADIALFGHSHVPVSIRHNNILLFNPGSISLPRGGSEKSYGIIEIKDKVMANIINIE